MYRPGIVGVSSLAGKSVRDDSSGSENNEVGDDERSDIVSSRGPSTSSETGASHSGWCDEHQRILTGD